MTGEKDIKRQIGSSIRLIRETKKMPIKTLASHIEVSEARLEQAEAGIADLTYIELARIADALGVVLDIRFHQPNT